MEETLEEMVARLAILNKKMTNDLLTLKKSLDLEEALMLQSAKEDWDNTITKQ